MPTTTKRKPPAPPSTLPKRLHPAYREVWRSSVAHLWPPSVAPIVARVVELRDRIRRQGDDVRPAMLSALLQLERELLLTPKAARASGVTVRDEDLPAEAAVDEPAPRRRSTVTKTRRDRVLRAVS